MSDDVKITVRDILLSYENAYMNAAIEYYGNKKRAAGSLGITRNTLYQKFEIIYNDLGLKVRYDPGVKLKDATEKFEDSVVEVLQGYLRNKRMIV